jgi:hypothetical protein
MTDPRVFLIRMGIVVLAVLGLAALFWQQLAAAFMGNPFLNGVIVATGLIGIVYNFRQVLRLSPEVAWLADIQRTKTLNPTGRKPVVLATVNVMLADSRSDRLLSALSLRSVLDGVAARLDEGREISRYMIGLLIFLGLLGTFWGLLQTIAAVGGVVEGLDMNSADLNQMMQQLRGGLDAPLAGMATAFSSSLFGLAGSLLLGFLDLQLGQAMGRFFNEVEDWLSAFARYNDISEKGGTGGSEALASGLSEEGARAMLALAQSMERSEADRQKITAQLSVLNMTLASLAEQIGDDRRLREQLAQLGARIETLSDTLASSHSKLSDGLTAEIRALSKAVMQATERSGKGTG